MLNSMEDAMRNIANRIFAVAGLFLCSAMVDAFAQGCTWTWSTLAQKCVSCPRGFGAQSWYKDPLSGTCGACTGYCRSFIAESASAEETSAEERIEHVALPTGLEREVNVSHAHLREINMRNPWAASVLMTIQRMGELADLRGGTFHLTTLPTVESVDEMLAGTFLAEKAMPMPGGVRAEVSVRLERGPGDSARLHLSSFTVDSDRRMLYKVYPDVVVEFFEAGPKEGGLISRQESSRLLTSTGWRVEQ
jgi:hypothetical protein